MSVLERRRRDDPRRGETERAFLRAAEELLDEGASFADLNVSRIATRADRTRTAFYAHFDDRRELLLRLAEELGAEAFGIADDFFAGASEREALRSVLDRIVATFRAHEPLLRAVVEASGYDVEVAAFWESVVGRFVTAARVRLEREGLPEEEAAARALTLVWMTERVAYRQTVRPAQDGIATEAVVDALTASWWDALRAARTAAASSQS